MSPPRVAIIGAGLAGPVLAVFLKSMGYDPVVYERLDGPSDAGLGIGIQPNGCRILSRIPGLLEYIQGFTIDYWEAYSAVPEDPGFLGVSDHAKKFREQDGLGVIAVYRPTLQKRLVEFAEKSGVEFKWDHNLDSLVQSKDSVTVKFANGVEETASFVIGCDGLHSNTRTCLFGEQPATYTGLSQWGGVSPTPERLLGKPTSVDTYGNGCGMIVVPVDEKTVVWMLSLRESESKESWKAIDAAAQEEFKQSPYSQWDYGAGEAVRNSTKIIRYGLYDRPELNSWHKGRVLLIGDAAHPTSPHLGQGANQAYEDINLLTQLLENHNPSTQAPSTDVLETIFRELEAERIPKSSAMVKGAREQGEHRTKVGVEECIKRNNFFREIIKNGEVHKRRFGGAK